MTDLLDFADFVLDQLQPLQSHPANNQATEFAVRVLHEMRDTGTKITDLTPGMLGSMMELAWLDGYIEGVVKGQRTDSTPIKQRIREFMEQREPIE